MFIDHTQNPKNIEINPTKDLDDFRSMGRELHQLRSKRERPCPSTQTLPSTNGFHKKC